MTDTLLSKMHVGINMVLMVGMMRMMLVMVMMVVMLSKSFTMYLLAQRLHQVLLGCLVKRRMRSSIRWHWRRRHIVAMCQSNRLRMRTGKRHHALDAFDMRLVLFALLLLPFAGLAFGCLRGRTRL